MTDYDAIIVGAGHNGLTAAAVLQQAGLRTLILEQNTYSGGMAATVELIDGFRFEIAGSIRFPTASKINSELGLDTLPVIENEIMSVNIGENGEEPMVFHHDPMKMMTEMTEKHGMEAVMGMAQLYGWATGPRKALGRFDALEPPKTIDEMFPQPPVPVSNVPSLLAESALPPVPSCSQASRMPSVSMKRVKIENSDCSAAMG